MLKINTYRLLREGYDAPYNPTKIRGKEYMLLRGENKQFYVPIEKYNKAVEKIEHFNDLSNDFNDNEKFNRMIYRDTRPAHKQITKFVKPFEQMINENLRPTDEQIDKYIKVLFPYKTSDYVYLRFTLRDGSERYLTISENSKEEITDLLKQNFVQFKPHTSYGSDTVEQIYTKDIIAVGHSFIKYFEKTKRNAENWVGRYFAAINTTKIDLIRYQIYNVENYEIEQKHCVIHALEQQGIEQELLSRVLSSFQDCYSFPISKLPNLAKAINRTIHLYTFRHDESKLKGDKIMCKKYEVPNTEPVKISLYKNHYFIYEDSIYTNYSVEHYEEVKEEKDFNDVVKKDNRRNQYRRDKNSAKLSSIHLVRLMDRQKMFDWNSEIIQKTRTGDNKLNPLDIILDNIKDEQSFNPEQDKQDAKQQKEDAKQKRKEENNCDYNAEEYPEDFLKKKKKVVPVIHKHFFYADLETIVKDGIHKPFMSGIIKQGETKPRITMSKNEQCQDWFKKMMKYIITNTPKTTLNKEFGELNIHTPIVFFHNLKYDLHMMMKNVLIEKSCKKDGLYYEYTVKYEGNKIILRDSYKMINVGLAKFKDMFDLHNGKEEAINYTFYDFENINENKHSVVEYKEGLNEEDKKKFNDIMNNVEPTIKLINKKGKKVLRTARKFFKYDGETFDAIKYYKYYLKQDVMTLYSGLESFNKTMRDVTGGLNSYDYITISRLASEYFLKKACFKDIAYCCGNLREYLGNAVYGGRVHVNESIKGQMITKVLNDYDANSLYPSAFYRMCKENKGLAKGFAKVIKEEHKIYDNIKLLDYYVVTVKITKIKKKQKNPFIQIRNDGISDYVNELPIKIIDGQSKEQPIITTIDKITLEDYINFHDIEFEILKGVYYNEGFNNTIGEVVEKLYNDRMKFKKTNPQMATIIKLILNSTYGKTIPKKSYEKIHYINADELDTFLYKNFSNIKGTFYKVNNNQYEITTATTDDSYNLASVGIKCLSYSKRIMNEVMGLASDNNILVYYQDTDSMHIEDADIKRLEELYSGKYPDRAPLHGKELCQFGSDFEIDGCTNVRSVVSCFLGKKSYLDILEGIDIETGELKIGRHIRLKGITEGGIEDAIDTYGSAVGLFVHLANGDKIKFILNAKRAMFQYSATKNGVSTHKERQHIRELQF